MVLAPLVLEEKILLPPLHIKFGLIKQFAKALDKESEAFKYLVSAFPKLSEATLKGGIFGGSQMKILMKAMSSQEGYLYWKSVAGKALSW